MRSAGDFIVAGDLESGPASEFRNDLRYGLLSSPRILRLFNGFNLSHLVIPPSYIFGHVLKFYVVSYKSLNHETKKY